MALGSAAAGAVGAKNASDYKKEAEKVNKRANRIASSAAEKAETCRKNCGEAIERLGNCKIQVLEESIKQFIAEFEKLNHVELSASSGLNELQKLVLDKKSLAELRQLESLAASVAGGAATGIGAGALTAFGSYGAAMSLATASTGTAIGSLSGAAATNATLAWFGGGSLAAGGLGIAGGAVVLGGLVLGPALGIMGAVASNKASALKDEAYTNLSKAKKYSEEMRTASSLCIGIRKRANMFSRFLLSLNSVFEPLVYDMAQIIKQRGTDFRVYTREERNTVAKAMAMAGAVKTILDTPLLDKDGKLTPESENIIPKTKNKLLEAK
ncbi:hypothetical protein IJT17_04385 [bacterium]|nr:hypothetical protein [bacterium]